MAAVGTSIALPGLGLVIAGPHRRGVWPAPARAGPQARLVGALIGWNIPEERIKEYESGIKDGGILMGVKPAQRCEDAAHSWNSQWRASNGANVYR